MHISALDVFYKMDGRESRYIKEVLEWYREEDARDLRRSELNELVDSMTCLSAFKGERRKSWKSAKGNQNIVMNEEFVMNIVMSEEFAKNSVITTKS